MKVSLQMNIRKLSDSSYLWNFEFGKRLDTLLRQWREIFPRFTFRLDYKKRRLIGGAIEGLEYRINQEGNPYEIMILGSGQIASVHNRNSMDLIRIGLLWLPNPILTQLIARRDAIGIEIGNQKPTLGQLLKFSLSNFERNPNLELITVDWENIN